MHIDPQETINQLGGRGLSSALVYTGTRSVHVMQDTFFLRVNGRRGFMTTIAVRLDPGDTYTVTLSENRAGNVAVYDRRFDVYCDELQDVVEQMYDNHMQTFNKGFIPLS